jgi:hypothetical protein
MPISQGRIVECNFVTLSAWLSALCQLTKFIELNVPTMVLGAEMSSLSNLVSKILAFDIVFCILNLGWSK